MVSAKKTSDGTRRVMWQSIHKGVFASEKPKGKSQVNLGEAVKSRVLSCYSSCISTCKFLGI